MWYLNAIKFLFLYSIHYSEYCSSFVTDFFVYSFPDFWKFILGMDSWPLFGSMGIQSFLLRLLLDAIPWCPGGRLLVSYWIGFYFSDLMLWAWVDTGDVTVSALLSTHFMLLQSQKSKPLARLKHCGVLEIFFAHWLFMLFMIVLWKSLLRYDPAWLPWLVEIALYIVIVKLIPRS